MVSIFWKDGETEVLEGNNISRALTMAGYGNSDAVGIDFYAMGDKIDKYTWDEKRLVWINIRYMHKKLNKIAKN